MVERWFAEFTGKAVRRGSFASVPDLIAAIEEFIAALGPSRVPPHPWLRGGLPSFHTTCGVGAARAKKEEPGERSGVPPRERRTQKPLLRPGQ
jgi:hypothetical protein